MYPQQTQDTSAYLNKKLKLEEINWVSGYYSQNGNHSPVTGGIGTEKLTDLSNTLELKLIKQSGPGIINNFTLEAGLDHYTSASSDKIDLSANSSASSADNRFYPSLTYMRENQNKAKSYGAGLSLSTEYDYFSIGTNINYSKKTDNRNGEFTIKFQSFFDQVTMIKPVELRGINDGPRRKPRNTYAMSLSYSQIINQDLQINLIGDIIRQNGYLGLPFHRVYFSNYTVHQEKLPDTRLKIPLAIMASYFPGAKIIFKAYYRYYMDSWETSSHTLNFEMPIKITPFFSLSPFYRFYTQTATKYFIEYAAYSGSGNFYTSNYDLSNFNSNFLGMGLKYGTPRGILGIKHFSALEIRYGHYTKNTGMVSSIISLHLKYK